MASFQLFFTVVSEMSCLPCRLRNVSAVVSIVISPRGQFLVVICTVVSAPTGTSFWLHFAPLCQPLCPKCFVRPVMSAPSCPPWFLGQLLVVICLEMRICLLL